MVIEDLIRIIQEKKALRSELDVDIQALERAVDVLRKSLSVQVSDYAFSAPAYQPAIESTAKLFSPTVSSSGQTDIGAAIQCLRENREPMHVAQIVSGVKEKLGRDINKISLQASLARRA